MDSTLVDLQTPWLELYNERWDDDLTTDELRTFDIEKHVRPECGTKIFDLLGTPGLFRGLEAYEGALETMDELRCYGHHIVVVTAAHPDYPNVAGEKWAWVREHMPYINRDTFCCFRAKELLRGDILVDDSPGVITRYRQAWPDSFIVGIAFPYNLSVAKLMDCRAQSFRHPTKAWITLRRRLLEFVHDDGVQAQVRRAAA